MTKSAITAVTIALAILATSTANAQERLAYSVDGVELWDRYDGDSVLRIEGTDDHDYCRIWLSETTLWVGLKSGAGNMKWHPFPEGYVGRIEFNGNRGDDIFRVFNVGWMDYGLHQFDCELHGGEGLDYLVGGGGNDVLDGGLDGLDDILIGGDGADQFVRPYGVLVDSNGCKYWGYDWEQFIDGSYADGDQIVYEEQ